ncbi:MAG: hypothetical protein J6X49_18845 [Victivallales bacterium]|nr:hypothetical protein [Victivallales bacterium]
MARGWPNKNSCCLSAYQMMALSCHIIIRDNVFCNAVEAIILHHAEKTMKKIDIRSSASQFS